MDDPELPDEYLREIGRVVVAWNRLESALTHALVSAVIEDWSAYERALAIFVHMSFPQKLDSLAAMLRIIEQELAALYRDEVQGLLRQAQEKRNAVLHQYWYIEKDEVMRGDMKARGMLEITNQSASIQELKDITLFIDKAFDELVCLVTVPLSFKIRPQKRQ